MFRWKRIAAVAAVTAVLLTGCSSGEAVDETGASGNAPTLTLGMVLVASTFSAADAAWANESPYLQAVYDTVVRADPDGEIVPGLATDWSYNDDNTVLTLTIRDGVEFTDGTPLDADAVAQNLLRFRDGNSPNKSYLSSVTDVVASGSSVELTLSAPDPALLTYLSQNAGLVESPAAFESADIQTVPVGSGPYTLDTAATVPGSSYVFVSNPDYWDPDSVHYDRIQMNVYADPTAMLNAIKGGQVNAVNTLNNNDLDAIEGAGFTLNPQELNWAGLTLMDRDGTMSSALEDVRVRQAINYAFDTEALLEALGNGYGTPTAQVFPESSAAFDPALDSTYSYDPKKAKQLLADAGYAEGLEFEMPSSARTGPATFTLIQQQLKDVGITVNLVDPGNNFIADALTPKFPVVYIPLQQGPDWALINFLISPSATWNPFDVQDPKVDELISAVQTGDEAEAGAAAKELNAYLVEQAWFAPWYRPESNFVSDATTTVVMQPGNAVPYLWNISPA